MNEEKKALKHKTIEDEIIRRAAAKLDAREFTELSIREICQKIGVSTGKFYRHFRNKNDLLSFCYIDEVGRQLARACAACSDAPLEERLLAIEMAVVKSSLIMGPNGIFIFLNNENPACDCSVSRGMTAEKIVDAIHTSGHKLSEGKTPEMVADQMTVILKGLIFEWFTKRDDPDFDFLGTAERLYRSVLPSLL